uniref:Uncharacterized protein n=1 Tax=viral metagenome TaxID=1070528 RepID=A0A6M3L039_9ZZZZ
MKLGPISLKLRLAGTRFGSAIFGSAEFAIAELETLKQETAFVVPIAETATLNDMDDGINQLIKERFGVVVALNNSTDRTGFTAFNELTEVRSEIFKGILGWRMPGTESVTSYAGGYLLNINSAYLWYVFTFDTETRILSEDGVEMDESLMADFESIWAQWILNPTDEELAAIMDTLPLASAAVDIEQLVDLS